MLLRIKKYLSACVFKCGMSLKRLISLQFKRKSPMSIQETFEKSVKEAQSLTERPSNEDLLLIYSLYKQATEGDNNTERPGGFDFKTAAKYNAWDKLKGMSKEDAMNQYIDLISRLKTA